MFLRPCVKYYDKMQYEEELDLFCSCISANINIMLHKTIYEINSTLLLRTHFKPPSSVCNNFLLRSHVEFVCLLLLKKQFWTVLWNRSLTELSPLPLKSNSILRELPDQPTEYNTHMKLDMWC